MSGPEKLEGPQSSGGAKGWFGRLRGGLSKTRGGFLAQVRGLVAGRIDEDTLEELEEILYMADMGPLLVESLLVKLKAGEGAGSDAQARVKGIMRSCLENPESPPAFTPRVPPAGEPRIIFLVGVNGVGKTTTAGKLASRYSAEKLKVMLAAGDTFRAAAGEQLAVWAERSGCEVIRHKEGADSSAVVYDAVQAAKARGSDVLLVDTAGRLHTKHNLMEELKKLRRVTQRLIDSAPHEVLLVLDATSGQNVLSQVREFGPALGVTGLVLTKLDGTAKGGVALGATYESGIPIRYVGVGESVEDLLDFDSDAFIEAIFGE
ncbi:MAG: signal recognition particle-docking protein FtsY [Nitrospinae bacterium]|nr:signal recognition particle-docking protein FtsY [Nitrospinota bacterium]